MVEDKPKKPKSNKVVKLKKVQDDDNSDTIRMLEVLTEEAKKGDLIGLVAVSYHRGNGYGIGFTRSMMEHDRAFSTIGQLQFLQRNLCEIVDDFSHSRISDKD